MHIISFEVRNQLNASVYKDMGDPKNVADPRLDFNGFSVSDRLADGATVDKGNLVYANSFRLQPSASVSIDLYGGSDTDRFGDTLTFTLVKMLRLILADTTAGLTVSLSGNFCTTNNLDAVVGPGGYADFYRPDATGYAVAAGSSDTITITNDSATVTADIKILVAGVGEDVSSSSSSSTSSLSSSSSSSSESSSSP